MSQSTNLALVNRDTGEMTEYGPSDFTLSVPEALAQAKELQKFIQGMMHEGIDYGIIPGAGNRKVLFKPGAEKLLSIYGFSPHIEIVQQLIDWETDFMTCEVKVTLKNKRSGIIEAEGVGSCNSRERRYARQMQGQTTLGDLVNTILKMAKKRALLDATLSATRTSGIFDIRDDEEEAPRGQRPAPRPASQSRQVETPPPSAPSLEQMQEVKALVSELYDGDYTALSPHIEGKRLRDLTPRQADALIGKLRDFRDKQGGVATPAADTEEIPEGEVAGDDDPFADE